MSCSGTEEKKFYLSYTTEVTENVSCPTKFCIKLKILLTDSKPDQVTYVEREPGVFDVVVKDTKSKSSRVNYTLYWCQGYTQTVPFCVVCSTLYQVL